MEDYNRPLQTTDLLVSPGSDRLAALRKDSADFLHSAAYAGLQAPITGLTQLVDRASGTDLEPKTTFIDAPEEAPLLSYRWHVQQLGSMVGLALPFLLLHKSVGKCTNFLVGRPETMVTRGYSMKALPARAVGESVLTGAIFDGVFRAVPQDQQSSFAEARLKNAIVGGTTFGVLSGVSLGLQAACRARPIRGEIVSTVVSGIPAGLVNAELGSYLSTGKHAKAEELWGAVYSFSVLGGMIGGGKQLMAGTEGAIRQQRRTTTTGGPQNVRTLEFNTERSTMDHIDYFISDVQEWLKPPTKVEEPSAACKGESPKRLCYEDLEPMLREHTRQLTKGEPVEGLNLLAAADWFEDRGDQARADHLRRCSNHKALCEEYLSQLTELMKTNPDMLENFDRLASGISAESPTRIRMSNKAGYEGLHSWNRRNFEMYGRDNAILLADESLRSEAIKLAKANPNDMSCLFLKGVFFHWEGIPIPKGAQMVGTVLEGARLHAVNRVNFRCAVVSQAVFTGGIRRCDFMYATGSTNVHRFKNEGWFSSARE